MMPRTIADTLVAQFEHMAHRDGGTLEVVDVEGSTIRVAYRPGVDPDCEDGACVLPGADLRSLMAETLRRRDPSLELVLEVI